MRRRAFSFDGSGEGKVVRWRGRRSRSASTAAPPRPRPWTVSMPRPRLRRQGGGGVRPVRGRGGKEALGFNSCAAARLALASKAAPLRPGLRRQQGVGDL
ncbi:hypothetical protein ACHAWF_000305, partial [Thalassiosira exigua]